MRRIISDITARRVSSGSVRHIGGSPLVRGRTEQIELLHLVPKIHGSAAQTSHGHLPDSTRRSPRLRPKPVHSMMADGPPQRAATARRQAPSDRRADRSRHASEDMPTGRTSRSAVPASDPELRCPGCSVQHSRRSSRSPHGPGPHVQTRGASDKEPRARQSPRSCGRSVVALYNAIRPHSSLGYRPPAPETILPPASASPYAALRPPQTLATSGRVLS